MREYAVMQYGRLLMDFNTFQIDDEYLDSCIEQLVPVMTRIAITQESGLRMGVRPLLESKLLTEKMLLKIIARLDAVVEYAEEGEEFTMRNEFRTNKAGKVIVVNG